MRAPEIALPGRAAAAFTLTSRWRALLGALLLTLTPGLSSADAAGSEDWPTVPDNGPRTTKRVPWMSFSGDPSAPVLAAGHTTHAHEVVVVREHEPTRRERRLQRRAERHAAKAAKLRAKAGPPSSHATVLVPVVHMAPPAPPAPPRTVLLERGHPSVHVVRLAQAPTHEHDDCDEDDHDDDDDSGLAAELEALAAEVDALEVDTRELHVPVVIDIEGLPADVQRQVERDHRDAARAHEQAERGRERAQEHAERARERAERARERAHRDARRSRR